MRRRRIAALLALALILGLALLCCGCAHVRCHGGLPDAGCPLCRAAADLTRTIRAMPAAGLALMCRAAAAGLRTPVAHLPAALTPVRRRVRLND